MDMCALPFGYIPSSVQREQAKTPIHQFLPARDVTAYFPSCCLWVQLLISVFLGAVWDLPQSPKELVGTFLLSPSGSLQQ